MADTSVISIVLSSWATVPTSELTALERLRLLVPMVDTRFDSDRSTRCIGFDAEIIPLPIPPVSSSSDDVRSANKLANLADLSVRESSRLSFRVVVFFGNIPTSDGMGTFRRSHPLVPPPPIGSSVIGILPSTVSVCRDTANGIAVNTISTGGTTAGACVVGRACVVGCACWYGDPDELGGNKRAPYPDDLDDLAVWSFPYRRGTRRTLVRLALYA